MDAAHVPTPGRRALGAALVVTLALAATAGSPARAEEDVPPAVLALDTDDAAARDAARAAISKLADADDVVVAWLRDGARRAKLAPRAISGLADLAGERGLSLANSGLRAVLRDAALPQDVRRAAARALGKTGTIADVGALGECFAVAPDECAAALVRIGGAPGLDALRRGGGDPPHAAALAARYRLGDRTALAPLVARLDDAAARPTVAALLREATGRDLPPEPAAWTEFAAAMDLAARFAADDPDAGQAAVRETSDAIRAGSAELSARTASILADALAPVRARMRAALAIGLSGSSAHNALLVKCSANLVPGDVRWGCANALARVGDLSAAVPLAAMLVHDEDRDRILAKRTPRNEYVPVDPEFVRALARMGLPGGVTPLLDVMAGEYRSALQRDSMRAIEELPGAQTFGFDTDAASADRRAAVEKMRTWWTDARSGLTMRPRADDRGRAAFAADVESLISQLAGFKFLYQMRAKRALAIVAEGAHERIVAGLDDERLLVRTGIAETMQISTLRSFAAPLASRLAREPNPAVRVRILWALETCARPTAAGWKPGDDVLGAVRAALDDRVLDVRIGAARTLGAIGNAADDRARIEKSRGEPRNASPDFRASASASLLVLGDRGAETVADVLALLRSPDVAQRAQGLRAVVAAGLAPAGYDPDGTEESREAAVRRIADAVSEKAR